MPVKPWLWTPKQKEALTLISRNKIALLEGGSRSGKTSLFVRAMYIRGIKYPDYDQAIFRLRFAHARASLWHQTLPKVARQMANLHDPDTSLYNALRWNNSEHYIELPAGNKLWIGGLDDKERMEKILGQEHMTILLNEISQMTYDAVEITLPRLVAAAGIPTHLWMDQNPGMKSHWAYKVFHQCVCGHSDKEHAKDKCGSCDCKKFRRTLPDGTPVPDDNFACMKMNPLDNIVNLGEDYLETLDLMTAKKKRRFKLGEYSEDSEGALWRRSFFKYKDITIDKLKHVVVGVDPSGSKKGDEIGIIVAGTDGKDFWVLDDYSLHGSPNEWGDETINGYEKWQGDCIVAEKNFGGDMVKSTITDMGRRKNINVKEVSASRGKSVRAEPISAMYERAIKEGYDGPKIFHRIPFVALEDELCTWEPDLDNKSPNRLDALVWALTKLSGKMGGGLHIGMIG